ncbi:hypothetical protein [Catellatospora vulcania]|uniref:hypothetical protein n=1 Tax=Catellatospora vulcania TaxID=1460450 RepID=UPI0012D477FD|nr:hypothetical protein [Catellatospora vulcania]
MTSTNITWLYRASVAAAAVSAALAVWSWWPTRTGGDSLMIFLPMCLVIMVILPGMLVSSRRQPNRNSPLAMWHHVRWFLRDAPRWAAAVWFLALAAAVASMLTVLEPGIPGPDVAVRMFPAAAFYFAVTGALTYRALARDQQADVAGPLRPATTGGRVPS